MENKVLTVGLGIGIILAVIGTMFFYASGASLNGFNISESMLITGVIIVVVGASWHLVDRFRNFRAGLPIKDEMSKRLEHKAGYYAFLTSIYIALGLTFFVEGLTTSHLAGAIILLSSITFMGLNIYYNRKGSTE